MVASALSSASAKPARPVTEIMVAPVVCNVAWQPERTSTLRRWESMIWTVKKAEISCRNYTAAAVCRARLTTRRHGAACTTRCAIIRADPGGSHAGNDRAAALRRTAHDAQLHP